jgi:hypothetical protein
MADDVDDLMVGMRLDTTALRREVAAACDTIEYPIIDAAEAAARGLESALLRAVRSGKLGFDDLQAAALSVLNQIAAAAVKSGLDALLGGGGNDGSSLGSALSGLLGSPGRATGGPVSPGRAYVVGERGPELFVPTSSGRVETGTATSGARDVSVAITVNASAGASAGALAQSSRQVARALKAALDAG